MPVCTYISCFFALGVASNNDMFAREPGRKPSKVHRQGGWVSIGQGDLEPVWQRYVRLIHTTVREQRQTKGVKPALLADASVHLHIVFFALGVASNNDMFAREKARALAEQSTPNNPRTTKGFGSRAGWVGRLRLKQN